MPKYKRISTQKVNKIILCFCEDITASATARIAGGNRNTVNAYYNDFREKIFKAALAESKREAGEFEVDEFYFGAKRVRGKRGRGAAGKTPAFALLKRGGRGFVCIVDKCSKEALLPVIQGKILEGATVHSDEWKAYDGLVLNGYDHYRVYHSENEFSRGKCHVGGILAELEVRPSTQPKGARHAPQPSCHGRTRRYRTLCVHGHELPGNCQTPGREPYKRFPGAEP